MDGRRTRLGRAALALLAACAVGGTATLTPREVLAFTPTAGNGVFRQVAAAPWLDHGKPVFLYVGAQYCPFCATERWALVMALSRFGHWSGLRSMNSTPGEAGYPGLATYDFLHASYHSSLIALQTREVADHTGAPLQALDARQQSAVNAYDPQGSIPFVLIAGRYGQTSAGYSPSLIVGLSFARIHALIYQHPTSALSRAVTREANVISALLCTSLEARVAACRTPAVKALTHRR